MAFETLVLQMNRSDVQRYWTENHFQGVSPPTTQASFQSIKKFVENVDGAVGYIPVALVDKTLRVVHEF
jgi:predicted ATP-grasp superfamily ATP-dependent carboligase